MFVGENSQYAHIDVFLDSSDFDLKFYFESYIVLYR